MSEKPKSIVVRCIRDAAYYLNQGIEFHKLGKFHSAIASYDRAILLDPSYAPAWSNRGISLRALLKFDSAVASFDKAIALNPSCVDFYSNRGNALWALRQLEAALDSYSKVIELDPFYLKAYANRGFVLKELHRFEESLAAYESVIAADPCNADAYWNKSLILLLLGDYGKGLELYEWRWKNEKLSLKERLFSQPLWLGRQPLSGKTVLIHNEQGFGDSIQFCRYATMVAGLGARVVFEVQKSLVNLLREVDGIAEVVQEGEKLPSFDFHCPLMSLPLALRTTLETIPCASRYLKSDPARRAYWKQKLGQKTRPRIGLAWSGNAMHSLDHNRSILLSGLEAWLPPEFQYVSLQKELKDADMETLRSNPNILHFGDELKDFSDTAALCDEMDLVISVDTSVAHLSGALGRPTWVLLPYDPDWRWMLDRDDTPWYPSVSLFRQKSMGDWVSVFYRISSGLFSFFPGNRDGGRRTSTGPGEPES